MGNAKKFAQGKKIKKKYFITVFVEVRPSKLKVLSRNKHFGGRQTKSRQSVSRPPKLQIRDEMF